jgi:hypothetical protein
VAYAFPLSRRSSPFPLLLQPTVHGFSLMVINPTIQPLLLKLHGLDVCQGGKAPPLHGSPHNTRCIPRGRTGNSGMPTGRATTTQPRGFTTAVRDPKTATNAVYWLSATDQLPESRLVRDAGRGRGRGRRGRVGWGLPCRRMCPRQPGKGELYHVVAKHPKNARVPEIEG